MWPGRRIRDGCHVIALDSAAQRRLPVRLRRSVNIKTIMVVPFNLIVIMTHQPIADAGPVMRVLPDGWAIAGVIVAIIAVIVAMIAAGLVGWQAWETRRATEASGRALVAAQAVAIDSARARLDAAAPRVRLDVSLQWPPFDKAKPMPGPGVGGDDSRPLQPMMRARDPVWHLPSDKHVRVCVRFVVRIENIGDRPAYLEYDGPIGPAMDQEQPEPPPRVLTAKQLVSCLLQADFTLEQWSENWKDHQEGKPPRHVAVAKVACSDDSDTCALDTWELTATGWPVAERGEGR